MMKFPTMPSSEAAAAPDAPPRKDFWSGILTSTPIILTVAATILAGLSSSEMTRAQYHRALAAQNQSKAGDQWGFFQAKRIRGMSVQSTIDLLQTVAEPGKVDPAALTAATDQFMADLERLTQQTGKLAAAVDAASARLGSTGKALQLALSKLAQSTAAKTKEMKTVRDSLERELARSEVQEALPYLINDKLPPAPTRPIGGTGIHEAVQAVLARRTESDTMALVKTIADTTLQDAIQTAESNILAIEIVNKKISDALNRLDRLVQQEAQVARDLHRAVRPVERLSADLLAGNDKELAGVRSSVAAVVRIDATVKHAVDELSNDYRVARHDFTMRRYKAEGDSNQDAATLYEVQVRKSSQTSERHRDRSKYFFYCMLIAQAGVTIATFSLAVKHRSTLWGLATLAGLSAISVGAYVYWQM